MTEKPAPATSPAHPAAPGAPPSAPDEDVQKKKFEDRLALANGLTTLLDSMHDRADAKYGDKPLWHEWALGECFSVGYSLGASRASAERAIAPAPVAVPVSVSKTIDPALPTVASSLPAFMCGGERGKRPVLVKHLWFVRHAEGTHNVPQPAVDSAVVGAAKTGDAANPGLTARGREQAGHLKGPVELLVVSPMRRTIETYAHSNLRVGRLVTSEHFREFLGYPPSSNYDLERLRTENVQQFQRRVELAIDFLREQPEERITVLSHGVFLGELCKRLGLPYTHGFANAEVRDMGRVKIP